jgi:hypothetical protein
MMSENEVQVFNKRGELVDCKDGIVPDGCGVRLTMFMMDSVQRAVAAEDLQITDAFGAPAGQRPGYVFDHRLTEAQEARDAAYDASVKRLEDAWRSPSATTTTTTTTATTANVERLRDASERTLDASDAAALRDQAYEDKVKRLADAWKTAR